MPSPRQENLTKIHCYVDRYDLQRFKEIWGESIGVSEAIRIAMKRLLAVQDAKVRQIIDNSGDQL